MKKIFLCLIMTVASVLGVSAVDVSVVKDAELLRIIQKEFAGEDVDFYLLNDNDSDEWTVFVDAEPMKGWWHDCYLLHVPKTADGIKAVSVKKELLTDYPKGDFQPLLVKNRCPQGVRKQPIMGGVHGNGIANVNGARTYAIILSGGVRPMSNYCRYWNDCSFIYQVLVNKYGVPKTNIYPIMSDGDDPAKDMNLYGGQYASQPLDLDFDGEDDIHLAAKKKNVAATLNSLSSLMTKDDHLFIFVICCPRRDNMHLVG